MNFRNDVQKEDHEPLTIGLLISYCIKFLEPDGTTPVVELQTIDQSHDEEVVTIPPLKTRCWIKAKYIFAKVKPGLTPPTLAVGLAILIGIYIYVQSNTQHPSLL